MLSLIMFLMLNFILLKYLNVYFISNFLIFVFFYLILKLNIEDWWMISLNMGLNLYSFGLIILSLWILILIIQNLKMEKEFNLCILLTMFMFLIMIMNFLMLNLLMFYFFFESSLLLIFYMIVYWSKSEFRLMASYMLMFYTLMFSLPMFIIIIYMKNNLGSLSFLVLEIKFMNIDLMMLFYLMMGFLVKIPMYLFHGWLLKAHVEAPYYGSMILASIMLKLGGYGLLRIMMIFYKQIKTLNFYFMSINLVGMILLSLMCLRQIDMKILIAISSVVHMGLMMLSLMINFKIGFLGSYLLMLAHGLSSSGLFYLVNVIYKETNSRLMFLNKGIMSYMPSMSLMWFFLCSSNMSAPFSLNLISEILMLLCLMSWMKYLLVILMLYCLLSFMYSIYLYSFIQQGIMENLNFKFNFSSLIMFLTLILHWIPLNIMFLNLGLLI